MDHFKTFDTMNTMNNLPICIIVSFLNICLNFGLDTEQAAGRESRSKLHLTYGFNYFNLYDIVLHLVQFYATFTIEQVFNSHRNRHLFLQ